MSDLAFSISFTYHFTMKVRFLDFELDFDRQELSGPEGPVDVEPQVLSILQHLVEHRDRVIAKDELIDVIWDGRIVSDAAVTSRINLVRNALGDNGADQRIIRTYPKRGYRFAVEDVRKLAEHNHTKNAPQQGPDRFQDFDRPRIVVLPFQESRKSGDDDFLAEGLTEEITVALSRCSDIEVIANSSARAIGAETAVLSEIGKSLSSRFAVQGSVQRAAGRLRVTARVVDTEVGRLLWADKFEASLDDLFELQDQVAEAVAAVLPTRIHGDALRRTHSGLDTELSSNIAYLKATWPLRLGKEAVDVLPQLEKIIARDDQFALAHAHLAVLLGYSTFETGQDPKENQDRVAFHARRSLELSNDDERVLTKAALAIAFCGDNERALRQSEAALRLNPNYIKALHIRGNIECAGGAHESSLTYQQRAMRLDPLFPSYYLEGMMEAYFLLGQYDEALDVHHRWDHPSEHTVAYVAACYALKDQMDEANRYAQIFLKSRPKGFDMTQFMTAMDRFFRRAEDRAHWRAGFEKAGLV